MTKREANDIAGTLSEPSKMPSHSYGLPAEECLTGSKLVNVAGSTCANCYALKGFYKTYAKTVKPAQYKRLESITHPQWVDAMVTLIAGTGNKWFRWHDSGDLQSPEHFARIVDIARALPKVRFWLPTREGKIVRAYKGEIPANLVIRMSATLIDGPPPAHWPTTSTVHKDAKAQGFQCRAPKQNNECGSCRACWNPKVANVSYHKH
jgi:hypothetical protein